MNVTYVSALYNIYDKDVANARLIKDVQKLLMQPFELILFVDDFYKPILDKLQKAEKVHVIHKPINELFIYNMLMGRKMQLPSRRNIEKDTDSYMSLMNQKVEFLLLAKEYLLKLDVKSVEKEYLAWIDAGCSKMLRNDDSYQRLANMNLGNFKNVLIPGCYKFKKTLEELCEGVHWNFLGTFFVVHRDYVQNFYDKSLQSLCKFMTIGRLTWEVNVWIDILQDDEKVFTWYAADHNDSFTHIPKQYLV